MSISLVVIAISMLAMFIYSFFTTKIKNHENGYQISINRPSHCTDCRPYPDYDSPCTIYLFVTTGNLDKVTLTQMIMIPAQLAGQIMMGIYLWKAGYISKKKTTWSPVSFHS